MQLSAKTPCQQGEIFFNAPKAFDCNEKISKESEGRSLLKRRAFGGTFPLVSLVVWKGNSTLLLFLFLLPFLFFADFQLTIKVSALFAGLLPLRTLSEISVPVERNP
ncbi:hypothetical protein P5673_020140 [Acropora cervicornis]|uniref:Uncharacterized protein n=1 Tax=Acropora cervicornis TaxID=6130 RepID=A0AAD9QAJ8_ACRCE|nr:hypothetical protein P5673_020140 [Acropora cervicornis]